MHWPWPRVVLPPTPPPCRKLGALALAEGGGTSSPRLPDKPPGSQVAGLSGGEAGALERAGMQHANRQEQGGVQVQYRGQYMAVLGAVHGAVLGAVHGVVWG